MPHPVLKISGAPGTGKTRQLAREAIRLQVEEGLPANKIYMLSLSAANQKRLKHYLNEEAELAGVSAKGTHVLHWEGFCQRFFGKTLNQPALLTDTQAIFALYGLMKAMTPPEHSFHSATQTPALSRQTYELFRHLLLDPQKAQDFLAYSDPNTPNLPYFQQIFSAFSRKTQENGMLSFPQLLHLSAKALEQNAALQPQLTQHIDALLVDDAQELSPRHMQLLQALYPEVRLVLSGCEQLSSREYRGADPSYFRQLEVHFAPITHQPLLVSMRGNEPMLKLLSDWPALSQPLWESHETTDVKTPVNTEIFEDPVQEARAIASWIRQIKAKNSDTPWSEFAILIRSSHFQGILMDALAEQDIPFNMNGLPDEILAYHHSLYDALILIDALCRIDWRKEQGIQGRLSTVARQALISQCNQSLRRLLISDLPAWEHPEQLLQLNHEQHEGEHEVPLLLSEYLKADQPLHQQAPLLAFCEIVVSHQAQGNVFKTLTAVLHWLKASETILQQLQPLCERVEAMQDYHHSLHKEPLALSDVLQHYDTLWQSGRHDGQANRVTITSAHQAQGGEWNYVALPFMNAAEWPHHRHRVELLPPEILHTLKLDKLDPFKDNTESEVMLLASVLASAKISAVMSCHQSESDSPAISSPLFESLSRLLKEELADQRVGFGEESATPTEATASNAPDFEGTGLWAQLSTQPEAPIFNKGETLTLSATAINTYMKCPRRFYYRHVLNLSEPSTDAAAIGSLIHRVLEVFNRQAPPYTEAGLKGLIDILFDETPDSSTRAINAKFTEQDLNHLLTLSPVRRRTLKQQIHDSAADLARKGYFRDYGNPGALKAEHSVDQEIPGLAGCRFKGKIDALIQTADGRWDVLDYKTSQNRWGSKPENCEKNLRHILTPLPEGKDLDHATRFQQSESRPRDYQLPLYYLALKDQFPIRSIALQLVRPQFADRPEQGSVQLGITADEIAACEAQIIDDLNRQIIEPIRGALTFETVEDSHCQQCSYLSICTTEEA